MKIPLFWTIVILFFVPCNTSAQNNYENNPHIYYNMKDTLGNNPPHVQQLPILELIDSVIIDSLSQYIKNAKINGYGQFEDSNGIYITMGLSYEYNDSNSIYVYISAIENYYLHDNMTKIYESINHFRDDGCKNIFLGVFYYGDFLVMVETYQFVCQEELSRFFANSNEVMTLKLYRETPPKSIGNGINPSLFFPIPLSDKKNYQYPWGPR